LAVAGVAVALKPRMEQSEQADSGGNGGQGANSGNLGSGGGGGGGLGGAIFNLGGALAITNCTLSGNSAVGGAGGSVAGPAAPGSGLGGAIFNRSGFVTILNTTIANNRGDQGGGIYNLGDGTNLSGVVFLRNTIVAGTLNGASDYVAAVINSAGTTNSGNNNLIQSNSGFSGGIVTSADPKLGALANNGGPAPTHALLNNSPAIDAGDNAALPITDGRGYPRIVDGDGNGSTLC
jgi:hypothetical protein